MTAPALCFRQFSRCFSGIHAHSLRAVTRHSQPASRNTFSVHSRSISQFFCAKNQRKYARRHSHSNSLAVATAEEPTEETWDFATSVTPPSSSAASHHEPQAVEAPRPLETHDQQQCTTHSEHTAKLADTLFDVGRMYFAGDRTTKNEEAAVKFFHQAAQKGHAEAQNTLATCYAHGRGVASSESDALYWWREGASNGSADAQLALGTVHANGAYGLDREPVEAFSLFARAAEQGNVTAMEWVAQCYNSGFGVEQDTQKAQELAAEAADRRLALELDELCEGI